MGFPLKIRVVVCLSWHHCPPPPRLGKAQIFTGDVYFIQIPFIVNSQRQILDTFIEHFKSPYRFQFDFKGNFASDLYVSKEYRIV